MGTGTAAAKSTGANASVGVEDEIDIPGALRGGRGNQQKRESGVRIVTRQLLQGLFGGGRGGNRGTASTEKTEGNVAAMAGTGASSGLPTCGDDGVIEMVFHQVSWSVGFMKQNS